MKHPRRPLRIAMLQRESEVWSLATYRSETATRLGAAGIELIPFSPTGPVPGGCDLVWDPGLGMRPVPPILLDARMPRLVVTVLGLRGFGLSPDVYGANDGEIQREHALADRMRSEWERLMTRLSAVVAISSACGRDVVRGLGVPSRLVRTIPLGVDMSVFTSRPAARWGSGAYLLHVSAGDAARKNLPRVLEAYSMLPKAGRPPFVLKVPEVPAGTTLPSGVRVLEGRCTDAELARLYQEALAFVFPSLYEGFGLPIVEAMACGCPVITSRRGGSCGEISGTAAVHVDPLSVQAIAAAMRRMTEDATLRAVLARRGLQRAGRFTWDRCAAAHERLLRRVHAGRRIRALWLLPGM